MATVTRDQIDAQLKDCDRLSAFLVQRSRATGRMRDASDYAAAAAVAGGGGGAQVSVRSSRSLSLSQAKDTTQ